MWAFMVKVTLMQEARGCWDPHIPSWFRYQASGPIADPFLVLEHSLAEAIWVGQDQTGGKADLKSPRTWPAFHGQYGQCRAGTAFGV